MYNGVQVVVSPFSGDMVVTNVTSTQSGTVANPTSTSLVGLQRTIPSTFFGYNGSALDIDDYDTVNMTFFGQSIAAVGGNVIRLPGGDESNFWNQSGLFQNTETTVPLAPWHFHGLALPIWIAYQTGEQTATRANFKRMFDAAGAQSLVYVVNCTTSTPAAEVAKIQDLITRGFPLTHIELGNELFFNLPYYTGSGAPGSPKYLRGHTSANAYMIDMRDNYVPALRTAFGTTYEIGIPIIPTDSLTGSRENECSIFAKSSGLDALIDFYAVHPYYTIDDLGVQKADVGNASRAGVIGKNAYKALLTVLRRASLAVFGETAKFLVTEFNVLEDQSQTGKVVIGQSWIHALIQCMNIAIMMRDRRIDMALVHSMLGNAQWSGQIGRASCRERVSHIV
jgi:hypothetical protein